MSTPGAGTACLINGAAADRIGFDSRGLAYGDGVFRTLLAVGGVLLHADDHLQRLVADAAALQLDPPPAVALLGDSAALLAQHVGPGRAVLKWTLVRQSGPRGYASTTRGVDRLVSIGVAPRYAAALWDDGAVAALSDFRLARQPRLAGIKHLNRLEQVLASRDWPAGVDELLLRDSHGALVGGSRSNLFWVRAGTLYTPSLQHCGIAGSMRMRILRLAEATGLAVQCVDAELKALLAADEAFFSNALIGIWPLRSLQDATQVLHTWAAPGLLTRQLQAQLNHPRLD